MQKVASGRLSRLQFWMIFGIIRYRTDPIPIKEMTYLFIVIGISIMNALANKKINTYGSGGMITKLEAAKICMNSGCHMFLANGSKENPLKRRRMKNLVKDLEEVTIEKVYHFYNGK